MHPRYFDYYNQELAFIRESAAEFAKEFPKIANRLTLDGLECADPYVERLLEGFAFLTARIQLKLDAEFPAFTQHLTEVIYPDFLAPTPAMCIARFDPDYADPALAAGFKVPRGTVLRGRQSIDAHNTCEFRTAHDLTLWPIEIAEARFLGYPPELPREAPPGVKGALRLKLRLRGDLTFDKLPVDSLDFYLSGDERVASLIYEYLFSATLGIAALSAGQPVHWHGWLEPGVPERVGFGDDEAMLALPQRSFRGYRLLREYAAFPARYQFFRLSGLRRVLSTCKTREIELLILLQRADAKLEQLVDAGNFSLYATPAINLFPKRADRIHLDAGRVEYHVLPDRTSPMDFEVYAIDKVSGHGEGGSGEQPFRALYASNDHVSPDSGAFYTLRREPRIRSSRQKQVGTRTSYVGTEVFLSLVDTGAAPFAEGLKQLSVSCLCTNRDLPIFMPTGHEKGDFTPATSLPTLAIRCLKGPSRPVPPTLGGDVAWQLISHLSLNYLSLTDTSPMEGAAALRQMLELYGLKSESMLRKQLEGIRSMQVSPIVRRMPTSGPVTLGRGLQIDLTCDEPSFEGATPFILVAVLEEFFARHAAINAFTETVLHIPGRGEIKRWKPRFAQRPIL